MNKQHLIIFEWSWKLNTVNKYKKEIEKILWWKVKLTYTWWHFLSTPSTSLWIKINNKNWNFSFEPELKITNKKIFSQLKKEIEDTIKSWWKIFIATDNDRAGAFIAYEIVKSFNLKEKNFVRLLLTSIEKEDFLNLISWKDKSKYLEWKLDISYKEAEETRLILDKLWWYIKSPIIWEKLKDDNYMYNLIDKITQ